ncbi:MAG TPA: hypothetical protein VMW27_18930 [Thermoanaerobaculia bacterium]|nr:hypothetical protein [Thermoanaerobaculia bacterium]
MRPLRSIVFGLLLVPWCWSALVAQTPVARDLEPTDALPIRYRPVGSLLELGVGELRAIELSPAFTYVGGQRFILGGKADAEQHLFVVADASKSVQSMYWIQIEERLPTTPGSYDYSADSSVSIQGFSLAANVLTYTTPPAPGSDRDRAFALLAGQGYRVPEGATRVRLIYLPDTPARREIMIIYFEATPAGQGDAGSREALISRAGAGITLRASSASD